METGVAKWLDLKITLGNLITIVALLAAFLSGYLKMSYQLESVAADLKDHKSSQEKEFVKREVQDTRNRFIDAQLSDLKEEVQRANVKLDALLERRR